MRISTKVPLRCSKCKSAKYIGDPYHAFGTWYVDVTCISCSHSKDIQVDELKKLLTKLEKSYRNVK